MLLISTYVKKTLLGIKDHLPLELKQFYGEKKEKKMKFCVCLFVCVEFLWPFQQLRSCRAGQLPINTVPGQA